MKIIKPETEHTARGNINAAIDALVKDLAGHQVQHGSGHPETVQLTRARRAVKLLQDARLELDEVEKAGRSL